MKNLRGILLLFLFSGSLGSNIFGQAHWESLVLDNDQFTYLVPDTEPPANWMQPEFNDASWSSAQGGFGYNDGDDNTILPQGTLSVYMRKTIQVPADLTVLQLMLDVDYDDAFVAYINGNEVARSSNLYPGTPMLSGSVSADHEARLKDGGTPDSYVLNPSVLNEGENLLAVHVMNISVSSSDMSARVFLHAEIDASGLTYKDTPDWFQVPVSFSSSNLPLVIINTGGTPIPDEPKITATMKVINNATGRNYFTDTNYEYDGYCGIEIRGNTAQMFPKKSYTVETRLADGSNNNVPLLGLPTENDWVFHGPYSDKSLMRNAVAYFIGRSMGGWHPRTRFVEMEINGEYRGVYLLAEKIKIDKNRVDIATLKPEDIEGDELTGGYIISIDRHQVGSWISPFLGRTGSVEVPFSYVDPKYDELQPEQLDYIRNYVTDFEYALHGDDFKDPELGYRAFIDVESFIDYMIITELSRDLDGYRVSVYFHKDKDSNGGLLKMTPFWDYNLCFGNGNFFSAGNPEGWTADGIGSGDAYEVPFWWDRLREDPYYETVFKRRWESLRANELSNESIFHFIDSIALLVDEAQTRNFTKFDILGSYVWPNFYVGGSYANEVDYLKSWFSNRYSWLDEQIDAIEEVEIRFPLVSTLEATGITGKSAVLSGNVSTEGGAGITERGFYYGTMEDPVTYGKQLVQGFGFGTYSSSVENLISSRKYYAVAYAKNQAGTSYGDTISFTTTSGFASPSVITYAVSQITDSSALIQGRVLDDGGAEVSEIGFYYGTDENPEVNGNKILATDANGIFESRLSNLQAGTKYYFKAYAENIEGQSMGIDYSFTTAKITSSFEKLVERFAVYPNPFNSELLVAFDLREAAEVEISFWNVVGEQVYRRNQHFNSGDSRVIINSGEFAEVRGIYFYTLKVNGVQVKAGKVIKE